MISLQKIRTCLLKENLLKEFSFIEKWSLTLPEPLSTKSFHYLSYDSRSVNEETLFFCKGLAFKPAYLEAAIESGLGFYVSETPYSVSACGIIVTDIKKAMAILSMEFYDYPQNKLKLIGFTGTKGKTTSAYFTKFILDYTTNHKTALLSTMNSTLDGKTYFKSQLTTPESLDLYKMMATAVKNNMTHFIMEVSSQAYKTNRVYGLFFDVGIFLNITPDHISPIEHPTFDDYFYCKRQLIRHSKTMVLNHDSDYFNLLKETADEADVPYITYSAKQYADVDYVFAPSKDDSLQFDILPLGKDFLSLAGTYHLRLGGDFNKGNAVSAALASVLVNATKEECQLGINDTVVPGRMELLTNKNGATIYVDYAHNYDSLKQLLLFIKEKHTHGKLIVVIGSTGNKALSRRKDFGAVLSELADVAILTADDPADEDPVIICKEIASHIHSDIPIKIVVDRKDAIKQALAVSQSTDAVVIAGKGADLYQKIEGKDTPYAGDYAIAAQLIND